MMIAVQMATPVNINTGARAAAGVDIRSAQVCPRMNLKGPLGGTKASEPRPRIGGQNNTDMTRDTSDRMAPSDKRQFAARELLPSDEESANAELRRMVLV